MKKQSFSWLTGTLILFVVSCNIIGTGNSLKGEKYYLLTGNISGYFATLKEIELNFISNDKVEARTLLYADAFGYNITNDSSTEGSSKIFNYKYEDGILELPDFKILAKLEFLDEGKIKTNEGEYFYPNSIIPLIGTKEADQRLNESSKYKAFTSIFKRMLQKAYKPPIRIGKNGEISFNEDKHSTGVPDKESLKRRYADITAKIEKELGSSPQLQGTLGEKYNEIMSIRKRVYAKLQSANADADEISGLLNQLNNDCEDLFNEIRKIKEENEKLSKGYSQ